jgi:hypothetical protein
MAMAMTAIDLITDEELFQEAKAEFAAGCGPR